MWMFAYTIRIKRKWGREREREWNRWFYLLRLRFRCLHCKYWTVCVQHVNRVKEVFLFDEIWNFSASILVVQQSIRTAKVFKPNLLLPKHRDIKVKDGQWVEKGAILTLQNNLVLYPGENVNKSNNISHSIPSIFFSLQTTIAYDYTIRSKVPGFLVITTESVKPYPHSPLYRYVNSGNDVKRNFLHVIPPRRQAAFRLVDQI